MQQICIGVLWVNIHLLFRLPLIPFVTSRLGENLLETVQIAFYGDVLCMSVATFHILKQALIRSYNRQAPSTRTLSLNLKEKTAIEVYLFSIPIALVHIAVPIACCIAVAAAVRIIPSRSLEQTIAEINS